jgi:hypothetical protein
MPNRNPSDCLWRHSNSIAKRMSAFRKHIVLEEVTEKRRQQLGKQQLTHCIGEEGDCETSAWKLSESGQSPTRAPATKNMHKQNPRGFLQDLERR